MERQCRICLDIDEPERMISPCNCRGSARFIHQQCLKEYLRHYPDGVCRVCLKNMISVYQYEVIFQCILFTWMCYLISTTNIPLHTKGIYMGMLIPLFISQIFSYGVIFLTTAISIGLLFIDRKYIIHSIVSLSVMGVLATISHYVPPQYILIIGTIVLSGLYGSILTIYIATTTDPYMLSYFAGFLTILWIFFTKLRPPFRAIN